VSPAASPELFRALAVVCEGPQAGPVAAALGVVPDTAEHTDLFSFQLPPYASISLGADGMLGGEPAGRVAGFWRALQLDPPAEPDHLAALLGLYAALMEAEEDETDPARRRLRGEACRALLAEHLAPWVFAYATAATRVASAGYRPWAEALLAAVVAEAAAAGLATPARDDGAGSLPLHLREAPPPAEPAEDGLDAYLGRLLAPVASGIVVTRRDLVEAARRLGLGLRMGERRFVLSALVNQDPAGVAGWLAEEAGAWAEEHDRIVPVLGDTARFWRERARNTEAHLRRLLSTDFRAA
jgi:hypothetical protein